MPKNDFTELLTSDQVAERYHVSAGTICGWVQQKMLPCFKIGRRYLFNHEALRILESKLIEQTNKEEVAK